MLAYIIPIILIWTIYKKIKQNRYRKSAEKLKAVQESGAEPASLPAIQWGAGGLAMMHETVGPGVAGFGVAPGLEAFSQDRWALLSTMSPTGLLITAAQAVLQEVMGPSFARHRITAGLQAFITPSIRPVMTSRRAWHVVARRVGRRDVIRWTRGLVG
ncbi:MAG: hypothetical protein IID40_01825 [Planctomycetes bacterium]|nr:hypothetical protein [Planctomycetota bacterium]